MLPKGAMPAGVGGAGYSAGAESPEQLLAMLEELQRQASADPSSVPPELSELLKNVRKEQGQPVDDVPTEEILPEPGFVIKTTDEAGRKVFINMCGHAKVAAPGNWANGMPEEIQSALDNLDNLSQQQAEALRFPLSMTPAMPDVDKKGEHCTVFDCCMNIDVIKMAERYRPLKHFIIELAMNWVGHKHKIQLDPKFKLPKMRYKGGQVATQRIRVDRKKLVTEIKEIEEDPVFPLLTKKPAEKSTNGSVAGTAAGLQPGGGPPASGVAAGQGGASSGPSSQSAAAMAGNSRSQPAGGPQGSGIPTPRLLGPPRFNGKPVQSVSLDVELPAELCSKALNSRSGTGTGGAGSPPAVQALLDTVRVEVCGENVYIGAPACGELHVQLPFAVSQQGAQVDLDMSAVPLPALRLTLPHLPVAELARIAAQEAPHSYGQLGLTSAAALELEP